MAHKDGFIIFNQRKIQDVEQLSLKIWEQRIEQRINELLSMSQEAVNELLKNPSCLDVCAYTKLINFVGLKIAQSVI